MKPVLQAAHAAWSARDWQATSDQAGALLRGARTRVLATVLDNGPAFVALDEAALAGGHVHVPLPPFFNDEQALHALDAAGVDTLVVSPLLAERWPQWPWRSHTLAGEQVCIAPRQAEPRALPTGTVKITFTSGTTGRPKGVCLGTSALDRIANGLVQALGPLGIERHLSVLPYAVLLENVAGSMAARRQGATLVSLPTRSVGLTGSSQFEPAVFDRALREHGANSVILLPQMLRAWCAWLARSGQRASPDLRFVAVGGAAVGAPLLAHAHALGIPAYEGYGLSEAASVQTLNLPGANRAGSAGRVLPLGQVRIAPGGEIEVRGSLHLGYLGDPTPVPDWWPSGDLGRLDDEGYLHIEGRRKNVLITAYGRNVSPEWVETALTSQPAIAQAVVLGDGQAWLDAVLWPVPSPAGANAAALTEAVAHTNAALPDYARIGHWVAADLARDMADGLFTPNGRPVRERVLARYGPALAAIAATDDPSDNTPSSGINMSFHTTLQQDTQAARQRLLATPIIQGALAGSVSVPSYLAFLREAYHHVRHTVPLLKAMKAALPAHHRWLDEAMDEYIEEEAGHDEWILEDIAACGGDAEAVRHGQPSPATELMVAYAYDTIQRGNPLGFFGMVHVLEGTSVSLALLAADAIQKPLGLPDAGFSYLRSHGTLDREHTAHFELLMDRIDNPADQRAIVHAANMFYRLYRDVFMGLPMPQAARSAEAVA